MAPSEKEKVKLDKDSILALYGNTPAVNFNQFGQVPAFSQSSYQPFGGSQQPPVVQPSVLQPPNGITQIQGSQWNQQQWSKQGQFPAPNQGQYVPNHSQQFHTTQYNQFQRIAQPSVPGQFFQQPYQSAGGFPQPNPFFQTNNIQQQLGSLNLGNPAANAGNIWQ